MIFRLKNGDDPYSYGKWRGIQQSPYGSSNSTAKKGSIGQS